MEINFDPAKTGQVRAPQLPTSFRYPPPLCSRTIVSAERQRILLERALRRQMGGLVGAFAL